MPIKAVLFDYMGTCLDWHTGITNILPSSIPKTDRSGFAVEWRQLYFDTNSARSARGEPPEDIDITHRNTLDEMLQRPRWQAFTNIFTEEVKTKCIAQWHHQTAWSDVRPALLKLRKKEYEVFVHANGTTRLQLDITRSAELGDCFDMLFSSEMLGSIKPARENYERCLDLIKRKAEECVTVAAHGYDVRGAKVSINVDRDDGDADLYGCLGSGYEDGVCVSLTDDVHEDHTKMKREFDAYLEEGMQGLDEVLAKLD